MSNVPNILFRAVKEYQQGNTGNYVAAFDFNITKEIVEKLQSDLKEALASKERASQIDRAGIVMIQKRVTELEKYIAELLPTILGEE